MKRIHLITLAFAIALISTNWHSFKSYDRIEGTTGHGFQLAELGLLFSVAAVWFLGARAYKLLRELLSAGIQIERERHLVSLWPIVYLLPLLLSFHTTSNVHLEDGTLMTREYGYGSDFGLTLFLFASLAAILFQIVVQMEYTLRNCSRPIIGGIARPASSDCSQNLTTY